MDAGVLLLVMGICTFFNFVIIISKYRRKRYFDATLDMCLLGVICFLFSTGINALCIGMIASAGISMYLWFSPLYLSNMFSDDERDVLDELDEN